MDADVGQARMTQGRWVTAGLLLLVAIFAGAFFATHHREEVDTYVGYSGRARTDPFFAASLMLEKLGARTGRLREVSSEKDLDATIVLFELGSRERRTVVDPLLRWVRKGGRLILAPDPLQ